MKRLLKKKKGGGAQGFSERDHRGSTGDLRRKLLSLIKHLVRGITLKYVHYFADPVCSDNKEMSGIESED